MLATDEAQGIPELAFGERFRVQSRKGRDYIGTFLYRGRGANGVIIRLDDRRIARLDDQRVRWSTYARVSDPSEPVIGPGDELCIETPSKTWRGTLSEPIVGGEIVLRLRTGKEVRIPRVTALTVLLMFRARDLKTGDRFIVRSKSGNEYRGRIASVGPGDRAVAILAGGKRVNLRLERIDMRSLYVPVPVSLADL